MHYQARIVRVGGSAVERHTLESLLRGAGHTNVRFLSPEEALPVVLARDADVLLLDLILASGDVFALLRAAAAGDGKTSRVPVIVTAPVTANDRVQATLQRGAEDYITTPFDASNALVLNRRIELCLARKQLREATVRLRIELPETNDSTYQDLYNGASRKFAPREFLEHLGPNTLADVRLGDHVVREMTVLFAGIRDFTALSETLTPQQNFNFLNSYLSHVTPLIRAHHGFVDKYIGDAIMALFPRRPVDALAAAVALQTEVANYNLGRKAAADVPIRIGIGLHLGDLMLGTIGEEGHMQTTVIAGAVKVASRIERLTKLFNVDLLVSSAIVRQLPEGHGFRLRHLGDVKAKGKTQSVEIYECYANDPVELLQHKADTADLFAQAIAAYRKGRLLTAGKIFTRVAAQHPRDTAASYYRDLCSMSVLHDPGAQWNGGEMLSG